MAFEETIKKYPKLSFLKSPEIQFMEPEKLHYLEGLVEDALFWIEQEKEDEGSARKFFFLGSALGVVKAEESAKELGLTGKAKEEHMAPHKQFYSQCNPYSGIGPDENE